LPQKNRQSLQEYDGFNFLDGLVLCFLQKIKTMSHMDIIKAIQNNVKVSEQTIDTCLFLLTINGLASNRCIGTEHFYNITEEGRDFLKEYAQIKLKFSS